MAILGAVTVAAAVSLMVGHAASLSSSSQSVGAGNAIVGQCETSGGLGIVQNLSGSNVVSVTVSQIDVACGNASISVAVNNGTSSSSGSGVIPAGAGSVAVTLASAVTAGESEAIDVSINGP
jgi:hypothetical protein